MKGRWLKERFDGVMRALNYEPIETTFALARTHEEKADYDRTVNEFLYDTLARADALILDINALRSEKASLPADAPPAMVLHLANKQDALLTRLVTESERRAEIRIRGKEQAFARLRDSQGRFLAAPKETC